MHAKTFAVLLSAGMAVALPPSSSRPSSSRPTDLDPTATMPGVLPTIHCLALSFPAKDMPAGYEPIKHRAFNVTCDRDDQLFAHGAFDKCASKCHKSDCVAFTMEGNEDLARCDFHKKWMGGTSIENAWRMVAKAELDNATKEHVQPPVTWSHRDSPGGKGHVTTAVFDDDMPASLFSSYSWHNPLATKAPVNPSAHGKMLEERKAASIIISSTTTAWTPTKLIPSNIMTDLDTTITTPPIPFITPIVHDETSAVFQLYTDEQGASLVIETRRPTPRVGLNARAASEPTTVMAPKERGPSTTTHVAQPVYTSLEDAMQGVPHDVMKESSKEQQEVLEIMELMREAKQFRKAVGLPALPEDKPPKHTVLHKTHDNQYPKREVLDPAELLPEMQRAQAPDVFKIVPGSTPGHAHLSMIENDIKKYECHPKSECSTPASVLEAETAVLDRRHQQTTFATLVTRA